MLIGKNLVLLDKGKIVHEYNREYFTHAATDKTEEYTKTSNGKTVQVNGQDWKGIRPAGESTAPISELLEQALNRLVERYPLDVTSAEFKALPEDVQKEKTENYPYRVLLAAADYGSDLWMRNEIQSKLAPSKPIDKEAGIGKMAKLLMAMNPKLTLEKATAIAKATAETEETEQAA